MSLHSKGVGFDQQNDDSQVSFLKFNSAKQHLNRCPRLL